MNLSRQTIGWIQGIVAVFIFIGIINVTGRYSFVMLNINPVIFSCCAFTSCALVLIAIGGYGPLVKETIRSVDTWGYGFSLMIGYIVGIFVYQYITSTESAILLKFNVILSLIISWLFLSRSPDKYQILGAGVIGSGVYLVGDGVDNKAMVFLLMLIYGIAQSLRVFMAEIHRPHAKAASMNNDPRAKARVIGFVMLIVSIIFLVGTAILAWLQGLDVNSSLSRFPSFDDFRHAPTVISGMVVGALLMAPLRLLEFSSSHIIKAENFITLLAFMTVSVLFWEWFTMPITGLDLKTLSGNDLIAVLLITAGGLIISLTRKLKKRNDYEESLMYSAQDLESVEETREIVANSLEHFESNIKKTAKALDVSVKVIEAILEDKDKVLAFKPEVLRKVAKKYRKNVATADALTGLLNKGGFMTALKAASFESDNLSLFFIDLNKFKPVNDTYGHEAGDYVLQVIADRLKELFPKKSLITRLGGDEYCILLLDTDKTQAEEHINLISTELEKDIIYRDNTLSISGSIGLANYPVDTDNAEELIKLADKQMYVKKSCR